MKPFRNCRNGLAARCLRPGPGAGAAAAPFRACKHVYLYRSPEDALVSLFHYHDRQKHLKSKAAAGIDAFCLAFLPSWEDNLAGYLRAADEGFPVLFVPYELLLQYPAEILSSLLRWLGARHDGATVERAVSNMQFSKLQAVEARGLFNDEAFFFRQGCKGSGRAELQPSTLDIIQERTAHLMERANARVLIQQSAPRPSRLPENRANPPGRRLPATGSPSACRPWPNSRKDLTGRPSFDSSPHRATSTPSEHSMIGHPARN